MHWQHREPQLWPEGPGVTVLEGEPGASRDGVVLRWLSQRRDSGGPTWRLQGSPQDSGTWGGLDVIVEDLLPALRERAPRLLARHSHELCLVVPRLRSELDVPQTLTDTVEDDEGTRNYAIDRGYRSLHGLIDLLSAWHELADPGPWSIACDDYDESNGLVHRFFAELVRRRGAQLGLRLLLVVGPDRGEELAEELDPPALAAAVRLALPRDDTVMPSPAAMTRVATELEQQLADDRAVQDAQLPRLIEIWRRSDSPERALRWQVRAMGRYNRQGLYDASLRYAADVHAQLERIYAEDRHLYIRAVHNLYFCYIPLGRVDAARAVVEQAFGRCEDPAHMARYCYMIAMLHARFLESSDQEKAEHYLQRALYVLETGDLPDGERHFQTVFMMNGLALVRLRQGRPRDALELCSAGIARLKQHLGPERHRLHRSVLLFNIAQIHAQIGPYEDAVEYLSEAMEIDPNYSEYYNDRGAVYFKMDRLQEAESDYRRAIELSPPYAEVWTNLGQCYRAMERMDDAIDAYSRALDLDPSNPLALVGRADAHCALDRTDLALEDYDRALTMEPDQPLVLASRAIAHYEAGRLRDAVADLDAAVDLAPDVAELYQNRAVALGELGRRDEAAADLSTYLRLRPDAEDRREVEDSLSLLAAAR